ncbi:CHAP domain-containing protein [Sphingobacterium sp. DN00404]|uniref:CHAP domain-containing protein n=1 Tax=Sphingobacterium micropteri TaxID=2763501 RepID=A0ABR7YKE9_9SPHI|nr:CHAP domain-containing protein [Sphingobacterium micropteri]
MYPLFLGILFIAVCSHLDAVDRTVNTQTSLHQEVGDRLRRSRIIEIAAAEIGVREATGNNDGGRVEAYLAYTGLGKGHAWCAAFVSWCYGQAGFAEPRNPWSPALFPNARTYCRGGACADLKISTQVKPADIFGIYSRSAKRINHVGLVWRMERNYILTVEGNVENRVLSKRRHLSTVHALSNWITDGNKIINNETYTHFIHDHKLGLLPFIARENTVGK